MNSKRNQLKKKLDDVEAKVVTAAFRRHGWRLTATAEYLGIPMSTLQSIIGRNKKLESAYLKHRHGRGRPFGTRKTS